LTRVEILATGFPKTGKDMVAGVWSEQTRGLKPTGKVPVRVNYAPKRQGYLQNLPMIREYKCMQAS